MSEFLEYVEAIGIYKKVLYHYRICDISVTRRWRENYLKLCDDYLTFVNNVICKYHKDEPKFRESYYCVVCESLTRIQRNYFFHPQYNKNYLVRKKELINYIEKEPYKSAIKNVNIKYLPSKEIKFVTILLKRKMYFILCLFFSIRPTLKKCLIKLINIKHLARNERCKEV
jgi:hypothetical protein